MGSTALPALSRVKSPGGPLLREYSPSRAPSKEWVARRALSVVASFGALIGATDFNVALNALGDAAFSVLDNQAYGLGVCH
ncbi:hypothetical protein [Glaciimonas immobilis]|uniref:Uncharacterized protein n=1 Tax=Glaciimonas immobilis TaxID=728004 RepID=A0A840RYF3_9BURK|nr:hypothetical protein [Glaciimonas immobilis]KAF3996202.1 hypothetical protein HAV38_19715 [Glaciimonas immobilis]MBB5202583.1 hypothetical protein [Glaciimonas immobilis]